MTCIIIFFNYKVRIKICLHHIPQNVLLDYNHFFQQDVSMTDGGFNNVNWCTEYEQDGG